MTSANQTQTCEVTGDMTFEQAMQVFESINISAINLNDITIDLGAVEQSDSAALAIMLEWTNQARKNRKKVSFSHVPEQLMRLIEMTHLDEILNLASVK